MIKLNNKTKLTTQSEKLFVAAGGCDSDRSLTEQQLRTALSSTINILAKRKSPVLLKIYQQYSKAGDLPHDNDIEQLLADTIDRK